MKGFFITATDTDAGKTFVSSGLLQSWSDRGYKSLGFKPVASGCQLTSEGLRNDDALKLMAASNVALDYELINPYSFEPAIAPHIAAHKAGVTIDLQVIVDSIMQQQTIADYILVEGVGGWLVPLNDQQNVADLACLLSFPVILVVNMRLGCINHALLTAWAIEQKGLTIVGWIANNSNVATEKMACYEENIQSLKERLNAPLMGMLPNLTDVKIDSSVQADKVFAEYINMEMCI